MSCLQLGLCFGSQQMLIIFYSEDPSKLSLETVDDSTENNYCPVYFVSLLLQECGPLGCQYGSVVRTSVFGWRTFPNLWLTCDHFVDKVSAVSQPTRPTQPSIPLGSVNVIRNP